MPWVSSSGTDIYYESVGSGDALVFAHGAGGNSAIWFNQIAHFQSSYQCVAFDHRTFARSPCEDLASVNPRQFSLDLIALLDALDIERAHLVGQSMGGFTVLTTAVNAPHRVASVTMSATAGGLPNPNPSKALAQLLQPTESGSSSSGGAQGILGTMAAASKPNLALMHLYQQINAFNTQFTWANLRSLNAVEHQISFDDAARIDCPVLFIAGDEDPLFPFDLLSSYVPHFPNARIERVVDAGHSPYFEVPAVFNRLLSEFLAGA